MSDDLVELAALMTRFLRAVSFRPGGQPRYHELHALFVDGAILIKTASSLPEISTVGDFIKTRQRPRVAFRFVTIDFTAEIPTTRELTLRHVDPRITFGEAQHRSRDPGP